MALNLVAETTRFREFGPLSGHTYMIGASFAPGSGALLGRRTIELDARKYIRLGGSGVLASRIKAFK